MREIVLVGAGGFAREVLGWAGDAFSNHGCAIKGFLSPNLSDLDGFSVSQKILGDEHSYQMEETDVFVVAIGDIETRMRAISLLDAKGAQFLTLIHPSAVIDKSSQIGRGAVICPFAAVSANAVLEDFVMMNYYSLVGHDARIGRYSILSPYALVGGAATVEEEVFMGSHSTVAPQKRIGRGSKISANSAAMNDVPPGTLVYGVPGKAAARYS